MRNPTYISKIYILSLLFILGACIVKAQNVSYYALTKTSLNGSVSTNVSGGQFITFMGDICYESNKKGIGVGHGTLKLNTSYSNSDYKVYMGSSYWGQNATFKFKTDMSVLNVVLENGDVYVYTKRPAPASALTCSLIRGRNSNSESSFSSPSSPTRPQQPVQVWHPCMDCGGTGLCRYCQGQGKKWYGNSYENCAICHGGMSCTSCYGRKGYYSTEYR